MRAHGTTTSIQARKPARSDDFPALKIVVAAFAVANLTLAPIAWAEGRGMERLPCTYSSHDLN